MKEVLGNISFWVGLSLGSLTILDFLLRDKQKKWLSDKAEIFWLWLDEQKAGQFTKLLLKDRVQKGLVILAHSMIIFIIGSFVLNVFFGFNINADFQIGQPRIYKWQIWIDVAAMVLSMIVVTKYVHPYLIKRLKFLPTVKSYLLKSLKGFGLLCLIAVMLVLAEMPIINPTMDLRTTADIENHFGGKAIVIILHTITAIIGSPIMSEVSLFMFMLYIGVYWIIVVYIIMFIFRLLQFILIRIAENPKGPVIALSGLLTGIGGIVKVFLT